jgi:glutamyl-tRNA synthetase
VKAVAEKNGFATDMKAYKADPTAFPGSVSDVAELLRIATTGLANTPDLWTIMQILGEAETRARLHSAIAAL